MPKSTGVWTKEEVPGQHVFSYRLAEWMARFLPKKEPVFDFGCGLGTYSKYLRDVGFDDVTAIEGEDLEELFETEVEVFDLTNPIMLKNPGNVICLEVAEHVPGEYMDMLLDNIEKACNGYLILSWAIRGQDGHGHIHNMDNYEVIGMLQDKGFSFLWGPSREARSVIESHCSWFRNTIMIFKKNA
jgi:2-polyprenyl-3-methyl-5-hydroxy-6-metoxy-1,4-benzoquinol methylase